MAIANADVIGRVRIMPAEFMSKRGHEAAVAMTRAALAMNDMAAVAEAAMLIGAMHYRLLARDDNLPFDEVFTEACEHAYEQSKSDNVSSLADYRGKATDEGAGNPGR